MVYTMNKPSSITQWLDGWAIYLSVTNGVHFGTWGFGKSHQFNKTGYDMVSVCGSLFHD